MISDYKLIVGIGNVGYDNTRHNLGFKFLDILQQNLNFSDFILNKKANFMISKGKIGDTNIDLIKPTTYVNASGLAVLAYLKYSNVIPESILVVHDDLNLNDGDIKVKYGGGHGGHNGLRNITASIGDKYHRIRLGIGHPGNNVADYVLEKADLSYWNDIMHNWCVENKVW